MEDLLYLDSPLYDRCDSLDAKFATMANMLLNNVDLMINELPYRLEEIEFYLHTADHTDLYTHRDNDQSTPYRWYFHKQSGGAYKGGTYKGLDITFGYKNNKQTTYGGILIRAISTDESVIIGPCNTVDHILSTCDWCTISDLVSELGDNIIQKSILYLKLNRDREQRNVYTSPRVGLSFKYPDFATKNYRFLTNIRTLNKYKPSVLINLVINGESMAEITKKTGVNARLIEKYINTYKSAYDKTLPELKKLKPSNTNILLLCGNVNHEIN